MEQNINGEHQRVRDDSDSNDTIITCDNGELPINLKQICLSPSSYGEINAQNTSTISKISRTKAFSIKNILGLDDKEKGDLNKSNCDEITTTMVLSKSNESM